MRTHHPFRLLSLIAAALISLPALAQDLQASAGWTRATVEGQKVGGAFLSISSARDAALVGASSPVARSVEIHEMTMDGDRMRMRAIARLPLAAGKTVGLKPGGYHLMLMGLKQPIQAGKTIPVTLMIEGADKKVTQVEVPLTVRPLAPAAQSGHAGH